MNGRIKNSSPRRKVLPHLGKISIGKKVTKNGKTYPQSLDYFHVNEDCPYRSYFYDEYGDAPRVIDIAFPSDDITQVCREEFLGITDKGKLAYRGDGQQYELINKDSTAYVPTDIDDPRMQKALEAVPQQHVLTLHVVLYKLRRIAGLWKIQTRGECSSIPNIRDTFDNIMDIVGTVGFIPFQLSVKKAKSWKPGVAKSYPVIELVPMLGVPELQAIAQFRSNGGNIAEFHSMLTADVVQNQLVQAKEPLMLSENTPSAQTQGEV